jgi:hypothetical protein
VLVGLLTSILILGVSATFLGKMLFHAIRSKNRLEAKTSVIDHDSTLVSLIASRLKSIFASQDPCTFNSTSFKAVFNNPPALVFPSPNIQLKLESDSSTDPNLKKFKDLLVTSLSGTKEETQNALGQCSTMTIPAGPDDPGVYTFCVALDTGNVEIQRSRSFLFSDCAFVQVRVDLNYQGLNQNQKLFGPSPLCKEWRDAPPAEKQFKITYRIFWKERNDSRGYFSQMGLKNLNLSELRSF